MSLGGSTDLAMAPVVSGHSKGTGIPGRGHPHTRACLKKDMNKAKTNHLLSRPIIDSGRRHRASLRNGSVQGSSFILSTLPLVVRAITSPNHRLRSSLIPRTTSRHRVGTMAWTLRNAEMTCCFRSTLRLPCIGATLTQHPSSIKIQIHQALLAKQQGNPCRAAGLATSCALSTTSTK